MARRFGVACTSGAMIQAAGVDGAEAGGGEGGEDDRVLGDALGYALASSQPGRNQVEGVGPVGGRA
ncbi:MAG: hypothetical protein M3137_15625 [Actinomycetota bacterium]|nr:hypothetical protein [Actinomycetota bacterium]